MPYGDEYRIELGGDLGEASRWIAVGRAFAARLRQQQPDQPINKTFRLPHSAGKDAIVRMVIRITPAADDRSIYIYAEPPCEDLPGGFLSYRAEPYTGGWYNMHYPNGEKAIVGDPEDERTADIELSHQLTSGLDRRFPHYFTGRMRIVVQCKYLTLQNEEPMPFMHNWNLCHGIYDPNPEPEPFDPEVLDDEDIDELLEEYIERQVWLIEIGENGVFGYPVDWSGRCCDSVDYGPLLPTDEEITEDPLRAFYRQQLSLHWAYAMEREGVRQLLGPGEVQDIFIPYGPWYYGQCWAFSYSGRYAQNVGMRISPALNHYLTSRFRFEFRYDEQTDTLEALKQWIEADSPVTFWKIGSGGKSVLWVPDLTSPTFWDGVEPYIPTGFEGQDAPIHVWYDDESERVLRYSLNTFASTSAQTPGWGGLLGRENPTLTTETIYPPDGCWLNGDGIGAHCARLVEDTWVRRVDTGGYDFGFYMADGSADGRLRLFNSSYTDESNRMQGGEFIETLSGKFTNLLSFAPVPVGNPCGGNAIIQYDQIERCRKYTRFYRKDTTAEDGKPMGALTHDREGAILTHRFTSVVDTSTQTAIGGLFAYPRLSSMYAMTVITEEYPPLLNFFYNPLDCLVGGTGCHNGGITSETLNSSQQDWTLFLVGRTGQLFSRVDSIVNGAGDIPSVIQAFDEYNAAGKTRTQSGIILIQSGLQEQMNRLVNVDNDGEFVTGYPELEGAAMCFLGWQ